MLKKTCGTCIHDQLDIEDQPCCDCSPDYDKWSDSSFPYRIRAMNTMYDLPVNDVPTLINGQLEKFKIIFNDEVREVDDIIALVNPEPIDVLVDIADWLADMTVFIRSEALKHGIPLETVVDIVMDSNESKLAADGTPLMDHTGKFLKGPGYWKPEPKIKELLLSLMESK